MSGSPACGPISQESRQPLLKEVMSALEGRDWKAAQQVCQEHLDANANDPDAHRHLGQIYSLLGKRELALEAAARATDLAPRDARTWSDLGRVHVRLREWALAVQSFARAVDLDPQYADGWHNLGTVLKRIGDWERAFTALKQALLIDPTRADTYLNLGNLLVETEQLDEAIQCFQLAATHDPTLARARSRLAHELSQRSQVPQAEALFRQALTLDSDDVQSWFGLGRTLEDLGQAEGALGCYRNVLRRQPGHGMALGQYLALVRDDPEASKWQAQAHAALTHDTTPDEAKALVGYGLAKHYDRRRHYRESAHAGALANAARRRTAGPLDRAALLNRVDNIISTYTPEFFAARRHFGIGTDQPVFIVGLPRSGTTLTEQILAAHPWLHGAGELPDLARLAIRSLPDETDAPWQAALRLTEMESRDYAYQYLKALRATATPGRLRISDKQPMNFSQLAFVALLFPNSRIIHCRRDARDNALSIWMENFNLDQRYATDFDDLAFFTAQYRRLMVHWDEALPLKMIDIQYEETVADLEGQARRLMAFLGAPWDNRCLDFHTQDRAVQTPSRWQVRQPIYTGSVGRWKHYAEHLPELVTVFGNSFEHSIY